MSIRRVSSVLALLLPCAIGNAAPAPLLPQQGTATNVSKSAGALAARSITDTYSVPGDVVPLHRSESDVVVRLRVPSGTAAAERAVGRALQGMTRHRATSLTVRDVGVAGLLQITASDHLDD